MNLRRYGMHGISVSELGLGCNNFGMKLDAVGSAAVVDAAIEAGITHFDTAEMYGEGKSEEFLGAALKGKRQDVVIATKFLPRSSAEFTPGDLAKRMHESIDLSLTRLGTDYVDIYYQHYADPVAPVEELASTFAELYQAGKIRSVALSNLDAATLIAIVDAMKAYPDVPICGTQLEWNLVNRGVEAEMVPTVERLELGIVPYFPLASGLLTGKYSGAEFPEGSRFALMPYFAQVATEENLGKAKRLSEFAEKNDRTLVELALGWLLSHDVVSSVIAGATTPEQVRAKAGAISWRLSADEMKDVDRILEGA